MAVRNINTSEPHRQGHGASGRSRGTASSLLNLPPKEYTSGPRQLRKTPRALSFGGDHAQAVVADIAPCDGDDIPRRGPPGIPGLTGLFAGWNNEVKDTSGRRRGQTYRSELSGATRRGGGPVSKTNGEGYWSVMGLIGGTWNMDISVAGVGDAEAGGDLERSRPDPADRGGASDEAPACAGRGTAKGSQTSGAGPRDHRSDPGGRPPSR